MKNKQTTRYSRRSILAQAAAGVTGTVLSRKVLSSEKGGVAETEHFYYKRAPKDGPWIDTQRGSRAFGFRGSKIFLSEDNARTWSKNAEFADAENIEFSAFLGNGNLVFATKSELFLSSDNLDSVEKIAVRGLDGNEFRPEPPRDPKRAGSHFYPLDGVHTFEVEGSEMLIWGNYCNVRSEPVPVNIYYSTDQGKTVKIAYTFGRNPHFQYKDTDPSEWLGNPDNDVICRHLHSVSYNPGENAFYACCGDIDRGHGKECHWLRGLYDSKADTWEWKVIVSSDANSRFKSGGINFSDGKVYWVADANGPKTIRETYDRGIFRCAPADIPDKSKHEKIYDAKYEIAAMTIDDQVILVPEYGNANPCDCGFLFSPDLGKTWGKYDLKEFGDRSGIRANPRNSEGWFRVGLRAKWLDRAEVLFIKPKA